MVCWGGGPSDRESMVVEETASGPGTPAWVGGARPGIVQAAAEGVHHADLEYKTETRRLVPHRKADLATQKHPRAPSTRTSDTVMCNL
ncbi:hypothetical protein CEXT_383681 [Caerostris extrusa]|uniref:Uncharacterized protein n=1 Tax=Caerostris extrusa TaxID=172846 RepID=A0AAV4MSZ7_CAEEX|nr:hypothetical protein CEXT_383681 [Caerostris extrusa]